MTKAVRKALLVARHTFAKGGGGDSGAVSAPATTLPIQEPLPAPTLVYQDLMPAGGGIIQPASAPSGGLPGFAGFGSLVPAQASLTQPFAGSMGSPNLGAPVTGVTSAAKGFTPQATQAFNYDVGKYVPKLIEPAKNPFVPAGQTDTAGAKGTYDPFAYYGTSSESGGTSGLGGDVGASSGMSAADVAGADYGGSPGGGAQGGGNDSEGGPGGMYADGGAVDGYADGGLIQDEYPSHYMPGVGRQVMADGGDPGSDPLVQKALEVSQQAQPTPVEGAMGVAKRVAMPGRARFEKVQRRIKKQDAGSVLGRGIVEAIPSRYRRAITPEEAELAVNLASSFGTGATRARAPRAAPAATSSLPPPSAPVAQGYRALASQVPMGPYSGAGAPASVARSGIPLAATAAGAGAGMLGLSALQNAQRAPEYRQDLEGVMGSGASSSGRPIIDHEATGTAPSPRARAAAPVSREGTRFTTEQLMDLYNARPGEAQSHEDVLGTARRINPEAFGNTAQSTFKRGGAVKKKSAKKTAKGR